MAQAVFRGNWNPIRPDLLCELTESFRVITQEIKATNANSMPMYFQLLAETQIGILQAIGREVAKGEPKEDVDNKS
jgi:hypothetical protein